MPDDAQIDPCWPKVLSLSVHEFRTPLSVVGGYIRMLMSDRAGALTEPQRRLLGEAEKSCARLTALVSEVSELATIEKGLAPFNARPIDLHDALRQAVDQLAPLTDGRDVPVVIELETSPAPLTGDPTRLIQALTSVIFALRRELATGDPLTIRERRTAEGYELQIGDPETIAAIEAEPLDQREIFDEWRGGVGLTLPVARRLLQRHGARLFAPPGARKAGARIVFDPAFTPPANPAPARAATERISNS